MEFILKALVGAISLYVLVVHVLRLPLRLKYPWNIPTNPWDIIYRPQSNLWTGPIDYEEKLCKKYPKLFLSFYGPDAQLLIMDPQLIKKVGMIEQRSNGAYLEDQLMEMSQYDQAHLFASNGKLWEDQRNMFNPAFAVKTIKTYQESIIKAIDEHIVKLNEIYKQGQGVNLLAFNKSVTLQVILKVAFGLDLSVLREEDERELKDLSYATEKQFEAFASFGKASLWTSIFPPLLYVFKLLIWINGGTEKIQEGQNAPGNKMLEIFQKRKPQQAVISGMLENKQEDGGEQFFQIETNKGSSLQNFKDWQKYRKPGLLMDLMSKGQILGKEIQTRQIVANLGAFLSAGHETTATTLTYGMYEISKNKEIERKLIDEVDKFRNVDTSKWDMDMFPYTKAVFDESLRRHSPGPNTFRRLKQDMMLDEFKIPKGTILIMPLRGTLLNERYWPEPYKFVPERFLGDEKYQTKIKSAFQPFGYGPRICIGKTLAIQEAVFLLVRIYQNFTFDVPKDQMNLEIYKKVTFKSTKKVVLDIKPRTV